MRARAIKTKRRTDRDRKYIYLECKIVEYNTVVAIVKVVRRISSDI